MGEPSLLASNSSPRARPADERKLKFESCGMDVQKIASYTLRFYISFIIICRRWRYHVAEKSDLPQGTLDLLLLKIVALGPVHGYAIAQRLQQVSRDVVQVPQGSLYPALHRLENRGVLASEWNETETGRDAKFYRLTRKGWAQLETETASWRRLSEAVGLILKMSEGGAQ